MNIKHLEDKVSEYRWLKKIYDNYIDMIHLMGLESDYFRLYEFTYAARGDVRKFEINPHRSIPTSYLKAGLEHACKDIENEMNIIKEELYKFGVEL